MSLREASYGMTALLAAIVCVSPAWGQQPKKLCELREAGALCMLPDGRRAAVIEERTISLVHLATGQRNEVVGAAATRGDRDYTFRSLAVSPDGKQLATGCSDRVVRLWQLETGRRLFELEGHIGRVEEVCFSPDGKLLASGDQQHVIYLWNVAERESKARLDGHEGFIEGLAFSPDGKLLASVSEFGERKAILWEVESGKMVHALAAKFGFSCVAFLPDGKRFATLGRNRTLDETVRLWDVATGKQVGEMVSSNNIRRFAISPDGKLLATDQAVIELWDLTHLERLRTLRGHTFHLNFVEFSRDSKTLAGTAYDALWTYDVPTALKDRWAYTRTGDEQASLNDLNYVQSVAISPDGRWLASGSWKAPVRLWDLHTRKVVHRFETNPAGTRQLRFSRDGTLLAASSDRYNSVDVWNLETRKLERKVSKHHYAVGEFVFAADGQHIVAMDTEGVVIAEIAGDRRVEVAIDHEVYDLAAAPGGKAFATYGEEGAVRLWEIPSGRQLRTLSTDNKYRGALTFSPDGRWLVLGTKAKAVLWNATTGKLVRQFDDDENHLGDFHDVEFSPDGRLLAGATSRVVRLWEVATGRMLRVLKGHRAEIMSLSFAPDGSVLASGGNDGSVKLWDISNLAPIAPKQRTWADEKRQRSIEARLLAVLQDSAVLRRAGGEIVRIPLGHLSQADRRLAAKLRVRPADVSYDPGVEQEIGVKQPAPTPRPEPRTQLDRLIAELDEQAIGVWMNRQGTVASASVPRDLTPAKMDQLVSQIVRLPKLFYLDLGNRWLTDLAARRLKNLPQLKELKLQTTQLTDAGVKQLDALPALEKLDLKGTKVSDAGAAAVSQFGTLTELNVAYTQLTDQAVPHLLKLSQLVSLDLAGTQLTDEGLLQLTKLRELRRLGVGGTRVSVEGLQAFQKLRDDVDFNRAVDRDF